MKLQTYGKQSLFNTGILGKVINFVCKKLTHTNNQYVKTLSTKRLIIVLGVNGLLASPLIPCGFLACPLFTSFMMR